MSRAGRPRASSLQALEDAAAELFLEQGYAATTVDQITRRAGVSRATFFNYAGSKSDLLWIDVDESLATLAEHLAECDDGAPATEVVRRAFLALARAHDPSRVPWAVTQRELMGTDAELRASALARLARPIALVAETAARRGWPRETANAFAHAVLGAAVAAAGDWALAGVTRRPLESYLDAALTPVCEGFAAAARLP